MACKAKVLLVEDDMEIREGLGTLLRLEGYDVVCAEDGAEALGRLREPGGAPCLILLDLMMPIMSGWEFREQQRRDPALAGIPVVVLTGDESPGEKAASLAAADFLGKPYDLQRLIELVKRYC